MRGAFIWNSDKVIPKKSQTNWVFIRGSTVVGVFSYFNFSSGIFEGYMFSDQSLLIVAFCLLTLSQYNTNLVYVKRQRYKIAFFGGGGTFLCPLT